MSDTVRERYGAKFKLNRGLLKRDLIRLACRSSRSTFSRCAVRVHYVSRCLLVVGFLLLLLLCVCVHTRDSHVRDTIRCSNGGSARFSMTRGLPTNFVCVCLSRQHRLVFFLSVCCTYTYVTKKTTRQKFSVVCCGSVWRVLTVKQEEPWTEPSTRTRL